MLDLLVHSHSSSIIMFDSTDVTILKRSNVHGRHRHRSQTRMSNVPRVEPQQQPTRIQRAVSYLKLNASARSTMNSTNTTGQQKRHVNKRSCFCRHTCCKLMIVICVIYILLCIRPDYSIHMRNSVVKLLRKLNLTSEELRVRPGQYLAAYRQASMPIVIIPGIISTGLELWRGDQCAEGRFRHRFWTSMQMVDSISRDHQCWLQHISLNLSTWYDVQ
jgi:hypothetical protein